MDLKMDKMESATRWAVVAIGVFVLIRLKLVLIAAAVPVLFCYWHYSNSEKVEEVPEELPEPESDVEEKAKEGDIYGDEFWGGKPAGDGFSWDAGRDELDDLLAEDFGSLPKTREDDLLKDDFGKKDFGLDGLGTLADTDFGLGADLDFQERHESKGKGKGKSKDKGKDGKGEADPKQVFVANLGDAQEDDLRAFFEQVGEVERLKVLKNLDGTPKGIGFVTFRTEEQAQKALTLHGRQFEGGSLVVRLAHGKNQKGGEKGEKGEGRDRDRDDEREGRRERPERSDKGKGKGRGKGSKGGADVDDALEQILSGHDGPLRLSDFDFAARRFLGELRSRDRGDNGTRFAEAMDMVLKYTSTKDRSQVRKWTAYVFTLLQKFDPALSEEIRERDQERRSKGTGRPRMARQTSDDD